MLIFTEPDRPKTGGLKKLTSQKAAQPVTLSVYSIILST